MDFDNVPDDGGFLDSLDTTEPKPTGASAFQDVPDDGGFLDSLPQGTAPTSTTVPDDGGFLDSVIQNDKAYEGMVTLGDNPKEDLPEAGFWSGVVGSTVDMFNSSVGLYADLLNEQMADFAEEEFPDSGFAKWAREAEVAQKERMLERSKFTRSLPKTQTLIGLAQSDSTEEFYDTFMDSPEKWNTFKEFVGSVIPSSAAFAGGAGLQGLKGAFGVSMVIDWGDSYQESLAQGKDGAEAMIDATTKSLIQSSIDTATLSAGKIQLAANRYKDALGQLAIQSSGGAGAEWAKHAAVGEETTVGKMWLEAGGELIGAPVDVYAIRSHEAKVAKQKEMYTKLQEVLDKSDIDIMSEDVQSILDEFESRAATMSGDTTPLPETGIDLEVGETEQGVLMGNVGFGAHLDEADMVTLNLQARVHSPDGQGELAMHDINWKETPVVAAVDTKMLSPLIALRAKVAAEVSALSNAEITGSIAPEEIAERKNVLDTMQLALRDQEILYGEQARKTARATAIVNEWVKAFAPDMKVIVSSGQIGQVMSDSKLSQIEMAKEWGALDEVAYERAKKKALEYNVEHDPGTRGHFIRSESGLSVLEYNPNDQKHGQADSVEVIAHEFGHALLRETFMKSDQKTRKALEQGYRRWLTKLKGAKTGAEFWKIHGGPVRADYHRNAKKAVTSPDSYWYNFDEYLANQMAKSIGHNKLVGTPVENFFKRAKALIMKLFKESKDAMPEQSFTDFVNNLAAKTTMAELNAAKASEDVATQKQAVMKAQEVVTNIMESSNIIPRGPRRGNGKPAYGAEEFKGDLDTYNSVLKHGASLLQMGKMNEHIPGLQKYIGSIKAWWNDKMQQTARADERLQQWNGLKPNDSRNLGRFMQDLTVRSYDNDTKYGPGDAVWDRLVEKHKMSTEMLALADLLTQDFESVLIELQQVQVDNANKTIEDDIVRRDELKAIEENFAELRKRNFFPLSRFGEWFTRVKAAKPMTYDGVEYRTGETITFESFESQKDMKKRQGAFNNQERFIVEGGVMNDTQKQFAGFPPQLLTMLRSTFQLTQEQRNNMAPDAVGLAEQQAEALDQLIKDLAPGKSFTKHMMHRKNTPGFSTDAVRSYANYFLHFGNYVARIKHKGDLLGAIDEVGESAKVIGQRTGDGSKRTRIQQFMQKHFETAMNPGNELANLRAVGFLWYLGFVPKSAMVNLTQVPLVSYPFFAARYGDTRAVASIARATKDAGKYWINPKKMKKGQMDMIDELIRTGLLDESMATELAAASEGSLLNRITPGSVGGSEKAARGIRRMAGAGAWMFQKAEKMNRRVVALAGYDLALQDGKSHAEAVDAARDAVETTQFEYARWNRPSFMQGKKSVMFLFWQYMQNSLFFLMHDPGRARYVAMMFLFAGLSGLPFAEDAMDLYDYLMKKMNKRFGEDFSDVSIRKDAREYMKVLGMNPDLLMHGASRYSFGMSALGDMMGVPIPNVDVSGSLSMGNMIPGFGELLSDRRFDANLGKATEEVGGAVVAMPIQLIRAIADNNPDTLKKFEKAMPSFARNMSKAYRHATRGEETLPDGTVVTKFNVDDSMHKAEIVLQGLGFASTRVAEAKAPVYMTKEILQYYMLRRSSYMQMLDYSKRNKDSKMYAKTWGEIRKFNIDMQKKGLGSMGIKTSDAKNSLKMRETQRQLQMRGIVGGKRGAQVSQDVYDTFVPDEVVK